MSSEITKRIISSLVLLPLSIFVIVEGSYFFYATLIIVFIISLYEWNFLSKKIHFYFLGYLYITISFCCIILLRSTSDYDYWILLIVMFICIINDIGGFVVGKIFKGPKLTKYSPNKTFSGSLGGLLLSICFVFVVPLLNQQNHIIYSNFVFFVILISFASQIGDIVISYFKRISNVKDTGKIIPGHGGILDRIDGMLLAFPVAYFLQHQLSIFKL
ncbi:phosphatidate cytidylyltransferase [Candidatus Pelagibacter sp.]|uniref:phosphatidate cytidylyltransferase n=1 Tax=Candidatus Pelagibacter sp. TaxID=2024849 RepID=UPI003D0BF12D